VLGIALSIGLAAVYPLPGHLRVRSDIEAVANGGRKEAFYINTETDRIAPAQEVRVAAFPEPVMSYDGNQVIRAELFKARNGRVDVVCIASRMIGAVPDAEGNASVAINWMVQVPSRGSFMLKQSGTPSIEPLSGVANIYEGVLVAGDREFANLYGTYVETILYEDENNDGVDEEVILLSTLFKLEDS